MNFMRNPFRRKESAILSGGSPLALTPVALSPTSRAHAIFVHGLGGDAYKTWMAHPENSDSFWPAWLPNECDVSTYTLSYAADATIWGNSGGDMVLPTRARSVLDLFVSTGELLNKPLIFICHSV